MSRQDEVIYGIEAELKETEKPERFTLERKEKDGSVWKIWLSADGVGGRLDESLEGAVAWWAGPPRGTGAVLSVVPEEGLVVLRFLSEMLPSPGAEIRIYPVQFLEKLRSLWSENKFAANALDWWDNFQNRNRRTGVNVDPSSFPWLRRRQRSAFYLPSWYTSFLWGPPGTGKTTTLGALIARYVEQVPAAKVLLLSTTNSAVDQAIVAVDKGLEELTRRQLQPTALRKQCLRIGTHFVPKYYSGREHLLPAKDFSLTERLMDLYKSEPPKQNAQQYSRWKGEIESIQKEIRKQGADALRRARVAALTTTGAVFRFDEIVQLGPYDLIVFDEASQVSLAHALALAGLGKRILFAGDPKQLAPVVQSEQPDAREWLGRSPFSNMPPTDHPSTCLLDEQSRMAKPICDVVSQTFYGGKLTVAVEKRQDEGWLAERKPINVAGYGAKNAYLIRTEAKGKFISSMGSFGRFETAELVCTLVGQLSTAVSQEKILVLTPYRAQRSLIRQRLSKMGFRRVSVSTVHRAQGSERDTVIFDPVNAATPFLNNEDLGPRLINVAVSRAQARLIVIASNEDLKNRYIRQIAGLIENYESSRAAEPIDQYSGRRDFPSCVIGKTVWLLNGKGERLVLKITGVDAAGEKLLATNCQTGAETKYLISNLRKGSPKGA